MSLAMISCDWNYLVVIKVFFMRVRFGQHSAWLSVGSEKCVNQQVQFFYRVIHVFS